MNSAGFLAGDLPVCGYAPNCPQEPGPKDPPAGPVDPDAGTPNNGGNTGNNVKLPKGDASIFIEKTVLKSTKGIPGISNLTVDDKGTVTQSDDTAKIEIDIRTGANSGWPKAKELKYFAAGEAPTVVASMDGFRTIATRNLGGDYDEYRIYSRSLDGTLVVDEELQLWSFNDSYITQYRDVSNGNPTAGHQAWSFGGTKTLDAEMPTGGTGVYNGRFGTTTRTRGHKEWRGTCQGSCIPINSDWRVEGSTTASLDFGTGEFNADLNPETWVALDADGEWRMVSTLRVPGAPSPTATYLAPGSTPLTDGDLRSNPVSNPFGDFNYQNYMNDQITLSGNLTRTVLPTATVDGNNINGTASLKESDGWITNQNTNTMFGGVFGADPNEVSGVFFVEGTLVDPIGGDLPIDQDSRATIRHSGGFNANCVEVSTTPTPSACPPQAPPPPPPAP